MIPLPEKLRPSCLDEIAGQKQLIGKDGYIKRVINSKKPTSILLFGPPGSGKTTIAKIYAKSFDADFQMMSAVFGAVADLKKIINEIKQTPLFHKQTILFVDEIHRFNKLQQDAFLPYIEDGTIILIGATTENPSFSLNGALLSRLTVLQLTPLSSEDLEKILQNYEKKIKPLNLGEKEKRFIFELSQGDGRYFLNMLENLQECNSSLSLENLQKILQKKAVLYDKTGDNHFNFISAFHKSIRGSDPNAALYWLSRMLEGGEDPLYISRRIIRIASEDIGLADPDALKIALNSFDAYNKLGSPEGELALAQAVVYLSLAPKSNSIYKAFNQARQVAKKTTFHSPPLHILNAPTKTMKDLGYSKNYDHETQNAFSGQNYFPTEIERQPFYQPVERGFEREMIKRLDYFDKLRKELN